MSLTSQPIITEIIAPPAATQASSASRTNSRPLIWLTKCQTNGQSFVGGGPLGAPSRWMISKGRSEAGRVTVMFPGERAGLNKSCACAARAARHNEESWRGRE